MKKSFEERIEALEKEVESLKQKRPFRGFEWTLISLGIFIFLIEVSDKL